MKEYYKKKFRELCIDYLPYIRQIPIKDEKIEKNNKYETVLIEFRYFDHLEFLLRNIVIQLHSWNHTFVCGKNNYDQVFLMCQNISKNIRVIMLPIENLTTSLYSLLLMQISFWDLFHGEKLLIYQEDSLLFHNKIEPFLNYDYIGAPWSKEQDDNIYHVGNGGFSLRSREKMKQVLLNYSPNNIKPGKSTLNFMNKTKSSIIPEDVFFSKILIDNNLGNVATYEIAKEFSQESIFSQNPLGGHNFFLAEQEDPFRLFFNLIKKYQKKI